MIATFIVKEKRITEGDSQPELAFYARNNRNKMPLLQEAGSYNW
jgi:hypothetical protein